VNADKVKFWDEVWTRDATTAPARDSHPLRAVLDEIVRRFGLDDARMLEVGCGRLNMQGLGPNYMATDISPACSAFVAPGRFVCCPATALPFRDNSFDFVFSIYVLEHVAEIETALSEIRRVTRPGGIVLVKPAWFCRPWNGRPWFRKPLRNCSAGERLLKLSVRIRNSFFYRAADLLQWRVRGVFSGYSLRFRKLLPNYETPDIIDADAEVWLDPLDVIRWFTARGDECLSHATLFQRWWLTADSVVVRVRKPERRVPA